MRRIPFRRRSGFTLLEVILASALSFLVLAALYQVLILHGKYLSLAEEELREPTLVRVLSSRFSREIGAVILPADTVEPPPTKLVATADQTIQQAPANVRPISSRVREFLETGLSTGTDKKNSLVTETPKSTRTGQNTVLPAERFSLLGNSQRILLFVHRPIETKPEHVSWHDGSTKKKDEPKSLPIDEKLVLPNSPYSVILYALRPKPPEKEEPGKESQEDSSLRFEGLIRIEIREPLAEDAWLEAYDKLQELLPRSDGDAEPTKRFEGPKNSREKEEPRTPPVVSRVIASAVKLLRFRYHNGSAWVDEWMDPDKLPLAIEIRFGFSDLDEDDDKNMSPTEFTATPEALPGEQVISSSPDALDFSSPYRIVVGLPGSRRIIVAGAPVKDESEKPAASDEERGTP